MFPSHCFPSAELLVILLFPNVSEKAMQFFAQKESNRARIKQMMIIHTCVVSSRGGGRLGRRTDNDLTMTLRARHTHTHM